MTPAEHAQAGEQLDGLIAIWLVLEAATITGGFPESVYGWLGRRAHKLAEEVSDLPGDSPAWR